jgi:WD40 repeat protein
MNSGYVALMMLGVFAAEPARKDHYGDPLPPGALARMGSVQLRHEGARLAFAPDGKTLISAGWDGVVRFWNPATGRQRRQTRIPLPKTPDTLPGASIEGLSPDGQFVAALVGEELQLYDTASGEVRRRLPAKGEGHKYFAFSADGKTLATLIGIADNYTLRLWDLSTGKERLVLEKLSQAGRPLVLSPDGSRLAYSAAGELHVRDTATGRELGKGPEEGWCFAFSPDDKLLAAASNYNNQTTVTLWETDGLKKRAMLRPSPGVTRRIIETPCLTFSPDGKLLLMGGLEALVVWDVATREERRRLDDRIAKQLVFSPDGRTLACAGPFEIRLWNIATGQRLHPRPGHDGHVSAVAVSPDGQTVASIAGTDSTVRLWKAATGEPLAWTPQHDSWIRSVAFASEGRLLISGGFGVVRLLDANGAELRRFVVTGLKSGKQNQEVLVSHLSPDGRRLAVISEHGPAQITVWDARTGERLACRPFHGELNALSSRFTPDGAGVTVSSRERLTIEDTLTGDEIAAIPGDLGDPVAFSPDGKLVAVGIHKTQAGPPGLPAGYIPLGLRLAEVATGEEIFHLDGRIEFAALSPDGRVLVAADENTLRAWDIPTGEQRLRRSWPEGFPRRPRFTAIASLAFLPNSRAVVTGMNDGTLLVWDLARETWPKPAVHELGRKELDALWADLATNARKAHRAIYTLSDAAAESLPFLADHLHPVAAVDPKRVAKLLGDLDSEQFAVREAAERELTQMGQQIEPALRRVLEGKPSLEARNRVQALRSALRGRPTDTTLRTLRAIRVLEQIGTSEARRILRTLAEGVAEARETTEARRALSRSSGRE